MNMRTALLWLSCLGCTTLQAQQVVWFDEPTSLKGRACWWQGIPDDQRGKQKPVAAGGMNWNVDAEWEQRSLPLGNGSIGCNVMGSIATERYTLNEKTLWRGGPNTAKGPQDYWSQNKQSAHLLPEIRQAFLDGDWNKAANLTQQNFNSTVPYEATGEPQFRFGSFTTMGELCIATGIDEAGVSHYRRALSLDSALATVSFDAADGTHFNRTTFVSYPANVMVVRFTASQPGRQNLQIAYTPSPVGEGQFSYDGKGRLTYCGSLDNNHMRYTVRLQVMPQGGTCSYSNNQLQITGADRVDLLLTADTDYAPNYDPDWNDPLAYVGVNPDETTQ